MDTARHHGRSQVISRVGRRASFSFGQWPHRGWGPAQIANGRTLFTFFPVQVQSCFWARRNPLGVDCSRRPGISPGARRLVCQGVEGRCSDVVEGRRCGGRSSQARATHAEQHERSFVLQLSRKDVCERAACSRGALATIISWYVADGSCPGRRYGICLHDAQPFQFLGSVGKAFFSPPSLSTRPPKPKSTNMHWYHPSLVFCVNFVEFYSDKILLYFPGERFVVLPNLFVFFCSFGEGRFRPLLLVFFAVDRLQQKSFLMLSTTLKQLVLHFEEGQ